MVEHQRDVAAETDDDVGARLAEHLPGAADRVVGSDGGARTVLVQAGAAWSAEAGGTSGALWGAAGWLAVHLYYLAGMGNRVAVLRDWLRAFVGSARPGFATAALPDGAQTVTVGAPEAGEELPGGLGVAGTPDGPRQVPVA